MKTTEKQNTPDLRAKLIMQGQEKDKIFAMSNNQSPEGKQRGSTRIHGTAQS